MEAHRGERTGVVEVSQNEKRGKASAIRMRATPRLERDTVAGQPTPGSAGSPGHFDFAKAHQPAATHHQPVASHRAQGHHNSGQETARSGSHPDGQSSSHCPLSILSAYAVMASQETPSSVHIRPLASDASNKGHGPSQSLRSPPVGSSRLGSQLIEQSGTHGGDEARDFSTCFCIFMCSHSVSTYRALTDPFPQPLNPLLPRLADGPLPSPPWQVFPVRVAGLRTNP
jgi:hypothetical protein